MRAGGQRAEAAGGRAGLQIPDFQPQQAPPACLLAPSLQEPLCPAPVPPWVGAKGRVALCSEAGFSGCGFCPPWATSKAHAVHRGSW